MFFMIIHGSRSVFHDSRLVLWFFMVSGWFISKLSALGAKWDVENSGDDGDDDDDGGGSDDDDQHYHTDS